MFEVRWLRKARATYEELKQAAAQCLESRTKKGRKKSTPAEGLFKQVAKTIQLLSNNPKHPGLQTHPYITLEHPYDNKEKVFEAYVQNRTPGAYRVFWCYGPDKKRITIIAITPHP
jgi:mRNA-degrading endonuclease RelE of RelBE toxin-antitoxin system